MFSLTNRPLQLPRPRDPFAYSFDNPPKNNILKALKKAARKKPLIEPFSSDYLLVMILVAT